MTTSSLPVIWAEMKLEPAAKAALEGVARVIGPGGEQGTDPANGLAVADAVIAGPIVNWDAAQFARARKARVVARTGIGYDNIDLDAATAAGVCITNTPDAPTESTAEFTIGLLLCLARRLCLADRRFRSEGWIQPSELMGIELAGKTLALIGLGRIGSRVAEIARALRMKVVALDPVADRETSRARGVELVATLAEALAAADFISLHVPLTIQTRGLIGAREFAQMKRGAMLINAARGPVVDPSALLAALSNGHLAGAALDVWDPEPASRDNPLLRLDNVVAMPHIASATSEGRGRNHSGAVECVRAVLQGIRPASLVNPAVWNSRRHSS